MTVGNRYRPTVSHAPLIARLDQDSLNHVIFYIDLLAEQGPLLSEVARARRVLRRCQDEREIVLREGGEDDVPRRIDGTLLVDLWDELVLPRAVRAEWQPLIERSLGGSGQALGGDE